MYSKLSCCDFAFPLISHDEALHLIRTLGFSGVDIGLFENRSHLQPSSEFENVSASAAALKSRLDAHGLLASDIFMQAELDMCAYASNHFDPARREHARTLFLKTLEYAAIVGSRHVSALPGVWFEMESYEASYDRCVEEHIWRVEEAKKAGLSFGIEAHVGCIIPTTKQALQFVKDVPGLGLTLDYSHFVRQGEAETAVDILLPYANHFHARGARNGQLQSCLSDSEIDFSRVPKKLLDTGFTGWICVEYAWTPNWEDCCRNDNLCETLLTKQLISRSI